MNDSILKLESITKSFGETEVLKGISIDIKKGEFITFLGASGCGKTTTLRIIAGLEAPDSGRVILEGTDVTGVPPEKRNVNTVFQNYALFPHMNVYDNIAYSLKIRNVNKEEIKRRVSEALELVKLPGYEKRVPSQLSGGQRQRVAIARATINRPGVLLLDEPLGALDLSLRRQMQVELKKLQKQLGITFFYITHDQEEAINMSDRIAVMKDGTIIQLGTPAEIYDHPKTSFVAEFIGTANILQGIVRGVHKEKISIELNSVLIEVSASSGLVSEAYHPAENEVVKFAVRSEAVILSGHAQPNATLKATVLENNYAGGQLRTVLVLSGGQTIISSQYGKGLSIQPGQTVYVGWEPENSVLIDMEGSYEKKG